MPKHSPLLRALALALPLGLAALPATAPAAAQHKNTHARSSAPATAVPANFPADASQHIQEWNADTATPVLAEGAKGPAVIRAQVMLDRAWFSVGEIDGSFGSNTARAVKAFQLSRGLPTTGRMDEATWQALAQQNAPAFATYVLTEGDVNGPYVQLPADPEQEAQLPSLGYQSMQEAIAERFHMSPKLLAALNKGRTLQAGQAIVVTDVGLATAAPAGATSLRIDKSDKVLYVLGDGDKVLGAFPISLGDPPLPLGPLKIVSKAKNPDYSYDPSLLRNPKSDQKLKLPPGPNNPVGVMWLGLSKEHAGIHGTAEPSQMARVTTNGCVRLTNWDVLRLSTIAGPGMAVEVQS
ncbi:L,D-transpeptidase [Ramlibacter sp. AN1133]|uniref:L,D-transpeptidase n=1 Tax=Ramlibacter sp. AN1133 TaxID=3133429 RepID=UPI0030BC18F3